jgi:glucokinase-like ROK family protein
LINALKNKVNSVDNGSVSANSISSSLEVNLPLNAKNLPFAGVNVKNLNKHSALDLIGLSRVGISRVEISRELGLTRAGVSAIVNDLIKSGLVRETKPLNGSGHGPVGLEINPERGYVLGVDFGASHYSLILSDFQAHVLAELHESIDITLGAQNCLQLVDGRIHSWLSEKGFDAGKISAIGMGVPGPIVTEAGAVSGPPIMPGWDKFPIRKWMEDAWQTQVSLSNDAELGALGEWAYGVGRGEKNLAYIKVGTGIGVGLLIDGRIYRGATGCAGEIGHITLDINGPLCTCGNHGCLEAFAGGRAIAQQATLAIASGRRTVLAEIKDGQPVTAADVLAASRRGDLLSQQIIRDAGYRLGTAIASLVNLFNPSMIVIGGGVSQMGDLLLEPIRQEVRKRSLKAASQSLKISSALLGRRSSAMGGVAQAISLSIHRIAEETRN